ncbi:aldose epimerase family protein [Sanguibacter sp. A247]|uniref:aldose epimerase family protein n=1 Tax=unclassified Sanguibacter TaxID=2645534 RepID=UPI003FD72495
MSTDLRVIARAAEGASASSAARRALGPGDDGSLVELRDDSWHVGVLPGAAGALAFVRVLVDGTWRDLLRPTDPERFHTPDACSSFPLIPWSNRVSGCELTFRGRSWRLPRTAADGTSMHGAVLRYAFDVVASSATSVTLTFDSRTVVGVGFPWDFTASLTYELTGSGLAVTTSVANVDDEPFPAGMGHHPYFVRELVPGRGDALLTLPASAGYALTNAVATGPAGEVPARADFREARPLGQVFVDDCLVAVPGEPARITYPGAREDGSDVEVTIDHDDVYAHWVVYVPPGWPVFAVEPATNANGGFALLEAGVPGSGVHVLEPGAELVGRFAVSAVGI